LYYSESLTIANQRKTDCGSDTKLEQNKQAYAEQVVADPNFTIRFPLAPGRAEVDALFASAGLTPTASERAAAIDAFGAG
jgi:hypothetical protein